MTVDGSQMINLEGLAARNGLFLCVGCGKCVSVCPMVKIFEDFSYEVSPRGVVESVLISGGSEVLGADRFWYCLTCDLCTGLCPAGVRFRDFVEGFRRRALEVGIIEHVSFCHSCGEYLQPQRVMDYIYEVLESVPGGGMKFCPRCRQYDFAGKIKALASNRGKLSLRKKIQEQVDEG